MKAVFRCDATPHIGFGHLSRGLALAEALKAKSVASVFAGQYDESAQAKIGEAGFASVPLDAPVNTHGAAREFTPVLERHGGDCIILDSYRADEDYLADCHALDRALIVIDDFRALRSYPCDAVLNFTWEAPDLDYPDGPALLLGPHYLLVRQRLIEQRALSVARERSGPLRHLLVLIGGADPKGLALRLVRVLLAKHSALRLRVIGEDSAEMQALAAQFAPGSDALPRQSDISDHLLWADAAITGGGLIKYECAYMSVPAGAIAQNEGQDAETRVFSGAGLVFDLGLADRVSDPDLAARLDRFLDDAALRGCMAARMRESFVPNPSANAAHAVLEAIER